MDLLEEMEDEEMEFMDGTWKKEINTWEELVGNNLLNQEAVIEGAVPVSYTHLPVVN